MIDGLSGPFVAEAREMMATRFEVVIPGSDRLRLLAAAEEALDEVERLEDQLSMYRAHSEISGLNAYAAAGPVRVEPRLFGLLELALRISRETEGAFDPTLAPLLQAWGFVGGKGAVPDPERIAEAREISGAQLVDLDADALTAHFAREGVRIDLGAIGKGYAIDRSIELLRETGIENALIHGGTSTVYGLGAPPGETGWKVALRDPRGDEGDSLGEVVLRDRALSVSAAHGKSFRVGDRLYGHVLDARTGEPAAGALLAAVSHPSATVTDAVSTALLVLGAEGVPLLEERFPDADFLLVPEGGAPVVGGAGEWKLALRNCDEALTAGESVSGEQEAE